MSIGPIAQNAVTQRLLTMRKQLDQLQQQLSTGKRATNYRDLGPNRTVSLNARGHLDQIDAFQNNITTVNLRINLVQTTLQRFADISTAQRSDNVATQILPSDGSQSAPQINAFQRLDEIFSLMNQDINGRRMFSGRATDKDATLSTNEIMDGNSQQAGLRTIVEERRRADMGTGNLGRLTINTATPGQATLSQVNGVDFGFKIGSVSSNLSNATAAENAGPPPRIDVAFTGLPVSGEKVSITLDLPDGASTIITLQASGSADSDGEFAIGADANATALNFASALNGALQRTAQTELRNTSALKASSDFFNISASQAPQRVNIVSTPEAATSLRDGTAADTIFWYQGDDAADSARSTSTVRADTSLTLGYGMRATETGFTQIIANLAAFTAVTFNPADSSSQEAYKDLSTKVRGNLEKTGGQNIATVQTELASVQVSLSAASERHASTSAYYENVVDDVESISKEEIASLILDLQTKLEASYQVTANLSKLSLVNYI